MLRAVPNGWFSYDFTLFDRTGRPVARVDLANWREKAKLEVSGTPYEAHHKAWASEFVLEKDGQVLAVAEKPSTWKDRFFFEHGGNRYELKKESAWGRTFELTRDGVGSVGSVRPKGAFRREWTVDMPGELPLEVRVFLVWLAVLLWRRADSTAASGAAGGG